jgi:hypothetical protein
MSGLSSQLSDLARLCWGSRSTPAAEKLRAAARGRETAAWLKSEPGPPATLGSSAPAGVRLVVWCRDCGHQTEPNPAEQAERYGAEMPFRSGVSG